MDTTRPSSQKQYNPPRSLTDEAIANILKDIEEGSPKKHAAESNGVSESGLHLAIKQGITDINAGEHDSRYARLVKSLREIEKAEIKWCRQRIKESDKGHKGAEWTLEHAYWRQFCGDAKILQLAKEVDELKGEANEKQNEKSS
jgi:hypothetical protein